MTQQPTFVFTRPGPQGQITKLAFRHPVAQWSVVRESEFGDSFARVVEYQSEGYYVGMVLSYEAAHGFDRALDGHLPHLLPLAWFAVFREPVEFIASTERFALFEPRVQIGKLEYVTAVNRVLNHIRAGDIYQANFTVRAQCEFSGDAYSAFCALSEAVPMPYACYADTGATQIVSLSPELFLARKANELISKPMKGTAPRKPSWDADEAARIALHNSKKDRAENTMIVDLMRNDLGRVCKMGSVRTRDEYLVERFPTVHQMTTTVEGELRDEVALIDIFRSTFPAGSITGAPKVRAMQIIKEIEPTARGIYCGSLGLFYPGGDFVCNVSIRTLEINGNVATLGIGSGIVADSDPEREWEEVLLKAKFLERRPQEFGLYEAFRYVPETGFKAIENHLRRLEHSCIYFGRPFPRDKILCKLEQLKHELGDQPNRVRLDLNGEGVSFTLIPEELGWTRGGITVMIPQLRLDPDDPRLYHKTTLRPEKYSLRARAKELGAEECLFLNTRNEFTEGTISSFIFKVHGEWIAPELACGLLPGVWRDHQVSEGRAREGVVSFDQLDLIDEIRIGNSVRGDERVTRIILEDGTEVYREKFALA